MTHSYVWHDFFIRVIWLIRVQDRIMCNTLQHTATHCSTLQHTAIQCNTLQHTAIHCNTLQHTAIQCNALQRVAVQSYVCHDFFIRMIWLILRPDREWVMYGEHMAWHIYTWDMTHLYVWHDSFIRVTWLIHQMCRMMPTADNEWDVTRKMSHVTYINESCCVNESCIREACHMYARAMSHIHEQCRTYTSNVAHTRAMSHIWRSHVVHVVHINE